MTITKNDIKLDKDNEMFFKNDKYYNSSIKIMKGGNVLRSQYRNKFGLHTATYNLYGSRIGDHLDTVIS